MWLWFKQMPVKVSQECARAGNTEGQRCSNRPAQHSAQLVLRAHLGVTEHCVTSNAMLFWEICSCICILMHGNFTSNIELFTNGIILKQTKTMNQEFDCLDTRLKWVLKGNKVLIYSNRRMEQKTGYSEGQKRSLLSSHPAVYLGGGGRGKSVCGNAKFSV